MGPEAWASLSCGEQQGVKRTCNAKLSFCLLADWGLQVKPSASPSRVLQMILYGSMNQVKASWTHEAEAAWKCLALKQRPLRRETSLLLRGLRPTLVTLGQPRDLTCGPLPCGVNWKMGKEAVAVPGPLQGTHPT
jgi:hypothetical protein